MTATLFGAEGGLCSTRGVMGMTEIKVSTLNGPHPATPSKIKSRGGGLAGKPVSIRTSTAYKKEKGKNDRKISSIPASTVSVRSWLLAVRGKSFSFLELRFRTPLATASSSARSKPRFGGRLAPPM